MLIFFIIIIIIACVAGSFVSFEAHEQAVCPIPLATSLCTPTLAKMPTKQAVIIINITI